jgi:Chromo (CHRromatin Organisation MOdifier) domain
MVDNQPTYGVEALIAICKKRRIAESYVKWKGYPDSWEPYELVENMITLDEFESRHEPRYRLPRPQAKRPKEDGHTTRKDNQDRLYLHSKSPRFLPTAMVLLFLVFPPGKNV